MNHVLNGGVGRARLDDMIAQAEQYRIAHPQIRRNREAKLDEIQRWAFRRTLAAVGLSIILLLSLGSVALAKPMGPGTGAGSGGSTISPSQSESVEASSGIPVLGLSLAFITGGGVAMLLLAAKRSSRIA